MIVGKHVDTIVCVNFILVRKRRRCGSLKLSHTASVVARNNVKAALWKSEIERRQPYFIWENGLPNVRYQNPQSGQRLRMGWAIKISIGLLLPNKVRKGHGLTFGCGFGKMGSGRRCARCSGRQRSGLKPLVRHNGSTTNPIVARYRTRWPTEKVGHGYQRRKF